MPKFSFPIKLTAISLTIAALAGCSPAPAPAGSVYIPEKTSFSSPFDSEISNLETLPVNPSETNINDLLSNHDDLSSALRLIDEELEQPDKSMPVSGAKVKGKTSASSSQSTSGTSTSTSSSIGNAMPSYDYAVKSGEKYEASCYAPLGSDVTADINGSTIKMKQSGSSGKLGIYKGNYTMPASSGVTNIGSVVYVAEYKGKTYTQESEGDIFAVGSGANLYVQVKNASGTAFKDPKNKDSGYITTVKKGAVDKVTDYYKNMYRLSSVGWVSAGALQPLTSTLNLENNVSGVSFENTPYGEVYTLHGTSYPPYRAKHTNDALAFTFAKTSGIGSIDISGSSLFSNADVIEEDGYSKIVFDLKESGSLWGYLVEYGDNSIKILCRPFPKTNGSGALSGITIGIDPGHGGKDIGAQGLAKKGDLVEKEINLKTAEILKQDLEAKGAKVIMLREGDSTVELSDRVSTAQNNRVDIFISIHANSSSNSKASGTEVFYYEPIAKSLASNISSRVAKNNDRPNRGAKHSNYLVTLNSSAPAVLVEVGFLTNRDDYDAMTSEAGMKATSKGITDAVVNMFK